MRERKEGEERQGGRRKSKEGKRKRQKGRLMDCDIEKRENGRNREKEKWVKEKP